MLLRLARAFDGFGGKRKMKNGIVPQIISGLSKS
jgi:hypothetical protein